MIIRSESGEINALGPDATVNYWEIKQASGNSRSNVFSELNNRLVHNGKLDFEQEVKVITSEGIVLWRPKI